MVDIRHKNQLKKTNANYTNLKIDINKTIREGALIENFESMYDVIIKALDKKKKGKSFFKLFDVKIRNTISINSPHYEKLNYRQNNIFNDPVHEEMLKFDTSIPINSIKLDYPNMYLDYKETNYLGNIITPAAGTNTLQKANDNNLECNIPSLNIGNAGENQLLPSKNLMKDFKKILFNFKDIVYHFYNYISIKHRNAMQDDFIGSNTEENIHSYNRRNSMMNTKMLITKDEFIKNYNKNYFNIISKNNSKVEFHISLGANVIQSVSLCEICGKPNTLWDIRKEFQFSKNKKESKTKCKYCNMLFVPYFYVIYDPNGGTEKTLINNEKAVVSNSTNINNNNGTSNNTHNINVNNINNNYNISKDKEPNKENTNNNANANTNNLNNFNSHNNPSNKKNYHLNLNSHNFSSNAANSNANNYNSNNIGNRSFEDNNAIFPQNVNKNVSITELNNDLASIYTKNFNTASNYGNPNIAKIKKIEYMSFEHLLYVYVENEIQLNQEREISIFTSNRNKRISHSINCMANLLKGEIKLRIENNKFFYFTLEDYFKKLFINKYNSENNLMNNLNSNNNLLNLYNEQGIFGNNLFKENQMKNNLTLAKLLKEIIAKKRKEMEEKKEKKLKHLEDMKKKDKKIQENKVLNIKFDIKDLIFDNKFKDFSNELQALTLLSGKNKSNDNVFTMSKEKENNFIKRIKI